MSWPPAPVPEGELAGALRPSGESTMLPAAAYTSAAVLGWERRHLFAGGWTCLGRVEDVFPAGTTQRALPAGDVGVLLTTGDGGQVRAFANTCRHRGHELLPEGGAADRQSVVCPYHAWAFGLDGGLRAAPGFREVPGFRAEEHGLVPLPVPPVKVPPAAAVRYKVQGTVRRPFRLANGFVRAARDFDRHIQCAVIAD